MCVPAAVSKARRAGLTVSSSSFQSMWRTAVGPPGKSSRRASGTWKNRPSQGTCQPRLRRKARMLDWSSQPISSQRVKNSPTPTLSRAACWMGWTTPSRASRSCQALASSGPVMTGCQRVSSASAEALTGWSVTSRSPSGVGSAGRSLDGPDHPTRGGGAQRVREPARDPLLDGHRLATQQLALEFGAQCGELGLQALALGGEPVVFAGRRLLSRRRPAGPRLSVGPEPGRADPAQVR